MAATATKVSIRPLHDRVIVSLIEEGEQKVGGIIIPFPGIKLIDMLLVILHLA